MKLGYILFPSKRSLKGISFTAPTFTKLLSSHWKIIISILSLNNLNSMQVLFCQNLNKNPNITRAVTLSQMLLTKTLCEDLQMSWSIGWGWEVSLHSANRKLITTWDYLECCQLGAVLVRGNESLMLSSQIYIIQEAKCTQLSRPKGDRWAEPPRMLQQGWMHTSLHTFS